MNVGGLQRSYWLGPAANPGAPLLIVLHGMGLNGLQMSEWTGLGNRGPGAGFVTVFPDACSEIWDDTGRGRVDESTTPVLSWLSSNRI